MKKETKKQSILINTETARLAKEIVKKITGVKTTTPEAINFIVINYNKKK